MDRQRIAWLAVVGAAVGATAALAPWYRRDIARARARVATGARIVRTARGPVECAVAGEGDPVLVIHGAGGGFDQGLDIGAPLVAAGFRIVCVSRFGYLGTPMPADASPQAQADAHAALLGALGIERCAVLGASAGAPSATQLAIRHPGRVRRLVLVVPALFAPRPGGEAPLDIPPGLRILFDTALRSDFLFWAAIRAAPRAMIRTLLATPPGVVDAASAEERSRVRTMLEHVLPVSARRLGLENDAAITGRIGPYVLEEVAAPTLVVTAEDDLFGTLACARYTAARIPAARLVAYPTGGHLLAGRSGDELARVAAFLRDAPGAGP